MGGGSFFFRKIVNVLNQDKFTIFLPTLYKAQYLRS